MDYFMQAWSKSRPSRLREMAAAINRVAAIRAEAMAVVFRAEVDFKVAGIAAAETILTRRRSCP